MNEGLELDRGKRGSSGGKGAEREGFLSRADGFIGAPLYVDGEADSSPIWEAGRIGG